MLHTQRRSGGGNELHNLTVVSWSAAALFHGERPKLAARRLDLSHLGAHVILLQETHDNAEDFDT